MRVYTTQNLYRGYCELPSQYPEIERTFFVEALNHRQAAEKARRAIAAIYEVPMEELTTYNTDSYAELMDQGVSDDRELRLFESGWSGGQVVNWSTWPLFLVRDQALLQQAWGRLQGLLAAQYVALEAAVAPFFQQVLWPHNTTGRMDAAARRQALDFLMVVDALRNTWTVASAEQRARLHELEKTLTQLRM